MSTSAPSAEAQLEFLTKVQRLFRERDFTATYKFALLIVLADLAVERGADDGAALALPVREIAERFIDLYWQQAAPYRPLIVSETDPVSAVEQQMVLAQNPGKQAAVIRIISEFRTTTGATTVTQARCGASAGAFRAMVTRVADTVSSQPLRYLQNQGVLGTTNDLELFLFSTSRESLAQVRKRLVSVEGQKCFYCAVTRTELEVDHFVPFALYPRDLVHNFVLADPGCNRSKSDSLAASPHLERWSERLTDRGELLAEIGDEIGITVDLEVQRNVARWAYESAWSSGARAWLSRGTYETVTQADLTLLAA